jgi:hypothetical protein
LDASHKRDPGLIEEYGFKKPEWFTAQFQCTRKVRVVYIVPALEDCWFSSANIARSITEFPFWLERFNRLKRVIAEIPILYNTMDGDSRPRYHRIKDSIMDRVYEKTGVRGQYFGKKCRVEEKTKVWIWKAQPRQRMDWLQHLG